MYASAVVSASKDEQEYRVSHTKETFLIIAACRAGVLFRERRNGGGDGLVGNSGLVRT